MDLQALRQLCAEALPHPKLDNLQSYGRQVVDFLLAHFASLPDQRIGRPASRPEMEALLREPPPEEGLDFARVLGEFQDKVAPFAFRTNHPRFAAFIPGAPNFLSVLGEWLCAGMNFFCGVWLEAPGPTQVELVVLRWFQDLIGYPPQAGGLLTSGGSEATLTALVAARERLSFDDRVRAILYQTEQRHWSVDRAARILGLRIDQLRPVAADKHFQLRAVALAKAVAADRRQGLLPWAVVANAGSTNTGTVDPLAELAGLCGHENLWLHVDAAYGWPAVLTEEGRRRLRGLELADSITLDPHKWFAQTFEAGCLLVRDGRLLPQTFALRPDYMQDVAPADDEINFADHGIALTRRFRALKIWLSVKVLGLKWYRALIQHCCSLAEFAQALLQETGYFEILSPRQLSIVCFRFVPKEIKALDLNALNQAIVEELMAGGKAFLSTTRLHGQVALRLCFVNWRTTAADVEIIVNELIRIGQSLSRSVPGQAG